MTPRTILVVGSSGAIGAAIVRSLHDEEWRVAGVDLAPPPSGAEPNAGLVRGDVTSEDTLRAAAAEARNAGGLWALVYCAGEYPLVEFDEYSIELWDRVHDVNVRSAYRLVRALEDDIQDGGRIVLVGSGAGHIGSLDVGYSSSKAALLGLARSLAMVFASRQILVNTVSPGVIESPMSGRMPDSRRTQHIGRTPLRRPGTPAEVAVAVAFLLDPRNTYMTGTSVDVNGGLYRR